ncbi:hypothetical protein HCN44_009922 [Aphidius gifuensis]|uniref:Uncharacterized protein n=1 Tax=Aphidius gifuensis TaxID=684658 RepID=A0A834Y040_APHGI|nr:hypothetical protein HCN44_009922 [Aphidius gifuensis]
MDPVQLRNGFRRIPRNALAADQPAPYQQIIQAQVDQHINAPRHVQDIAPVHHGIPAPVMQHNVAQAAAPLNNIPGHQGIPAPGMQHNVAQQLVQAAAPLNNIPGHQGIPAPVMQHNVAQAAVPLNNIPGHQGIPAPGMQHNVAQQLVQAAAPLNNIPGHQGIPAPVMQHNAAQQLGQALDPLNNLPVHQQGVEPQAPLNNIPGHQGIPPQASSVQHNVSPRLDQEDEHVPIEPIDEQDIASGFVNQLENVPDNHQKLTNDLYNIGRALPRHNCDDFERRYNARFDREFPPFPPRSPGDRAGPSRPRILRRTN